MARAIDSCDVDGVAAIQKGDDALTRWPEVVALCDQWASIVRQRLDTVVEGRRHSVRCRVQVVSLWHRSNGWH